MQLINAAVTGISADYVSAIRNWVCPECGGRMGGRSKEFQCQGRCGTRLAGGLGERTRRPAQALPADAGRAFSNPDRPVHKTALG